MIPPTATPTVEEKRVEELVKKLGFGGLLKFHTPPGELRQYLVFNPRRAEQRAIHWVPSFDLGMGSRARRSTPVSAPLDQTYECAIWTAGDRTAPPDPKVMGFLLSPRVRRHAP